MLTRVACPERPVTDDEEAEPCLRDQVWDRHGSRQKQADRNGSGLVDLGNLPQGNGGKKLITVRQVD